LRIAGVPYYAGSRACNTSLLLNGVRVGNLDAVHQSSSEKYEFPISIPGDGVTRLEFQFSGVRKRPRGDPDPRQLCFYLKSMEVRQR
jgi:hypothetical protein